ncbi:hypothetical protein [Nocardiopsis coralliicola]
MHGSNRNPAPRGDRDPGAEAAARLADHPLFAELRRLDLPAGDYIIAGSGPLLAHGIRREIGDLDVVLRGSAWRRVSRLGPVGTAPWEGVNRVMLAGGRLEMLDGWFPSLWDTDEFIDARTTVAGIPFAPLERVLRWKRRLGRAKDIADVNNLIEYLAATADLGLPPLDEIGPLR